MSSLARVRYSGSLFQSNVCNLFSLGNLPLSVLLRCPWWRSVRKARVDCTQRARGQVHPWPLAGFVLDSPAFKSSSALVNSQVVCLRPVGILNPLTNRPQFPMVYTLINQRNGVIKCSKLKWNHEPLASGLNAKFWTFYGVISIVYKSVDHGKLWSIFYLFFLFFYFYSNIYF